MTPASKRPELVWGRSGRRDVVSALVAARAAEQCVVVDFGERLHRGVQGEEVSVVLLRRMKLRRLCHADAILPCLRLYQLEILRISSNGPRLRTAGDNHQQSFSRRLALGDGNEPLRDRAMHTPAGTNIISALDLRSHSIRIATNWRKDATSIGQVNGHHSLRRTYEAAQNLRLGCVVGKHDVGEFRALLLPDAKLYTPAEQQNSSPVTIPCLRATADTLAPGCSVSLAIASFSSSLKKRRMGAAGAVGSPISAAVKLLSGVEFLAPVLTAGRAEE